MATFIKARNSPGASSTRTYRNLDQASYVT